MIKIIILLTCLLLSAITAPAFAHDAEYSKECLKVQKMYFGYVMCLIVMMV